MEQAILFFVIRSYRPISSFALFILGNAKLDCRKDVVTRSGFKSKLPLSRLLFTGRRNSSADHTGFLGIGLVPLSRLCYAGFSLDMMHIVNHSRTCIY